MAVESVKPCLCGAAMRRVLRAGMARWACPSCDGGTRPVPTRPDTSVREALAALDAGKADPCLPHEYPALVAISAASYWHAGGSGAESMRLLLREWCQEHGEKVEAVLSWPLAAFAARVAPSLKRGKP